MKTLSFNKVGDPKEVLELTEKKIPIPADNEILVKVLGSPIHPADYFFINGAYRYKPAFPQTAGLEGAGIIESVGKNVSLSIGKLVAFEARGCWAQYAVIPKEAVIPLPSDFPVDKAVQFFLNPFTAWGLLEASKARSEEWLLLTAANSTVSRLVIQLAKLKKIKIIAIVRDLTQTNELKSLGADWVLNAKDPNFPEEVKEITSGGVHAALDAVGGETGTRVLQSMAPQGSVIIYGLLSKRPVQYYNADIVFKNLAINGFGIRGFLQKQTKSQRTEMINTLIKEVKKTSFTLPVAQVLPLERFRNALVINEKQGIKGKIIFK